MSVNFAKVVRAYLVAVSLRHAAALSCWDLACESTNSRFRGRLQDPKTYVAASGGPIERDFHGGSFSAASRQAVLPTATCGSYYSEIRRERERETGRKSRLLRTDINPSDVTRRWR